jgi:hypothetical protein
VTLIADDGDESNDPDPGDAGPNPDPIDSTPPVITVVVTPPSNSAGWNNSPVTVDWTVTDPESGIASTVGCVDQTLANETGGMVLSCHAVNGDGLQATVFTRLIRIDMTAPVTTASLVPAAPNGERGWYVTDVTVCLDATDPLLSNGDAPSGVDYTKFRLNGGDWQNYGGCFPVGLEGWNQVDFYSEDKADNVEATKNVRFKLDKTRPDSGNTLASQQPPDPNQPDWPPPYPAKELAYSLSVPLHTGINNIDVVAEDCAGWEKPIFIQIVYVIPGPYDPRTIGFWYNAVKTGKYTPTEMQTLLDYVNVVSDTWGPATRNIYGLGTMSNYRGILNTNATDMEEMQKAQLLGAWLNLVSGRVAVLTPADLTLVMGWAQVVDNTGGSPLTFALNVPMEVEEIDQTRTASRGVYEIAKNLLDAFNNRRIIP